jgi:NTP pyrophosphatase (non-canonical NTP hydrolase)
MDEDTTIKQLKDIVQKFCEDRDWDQYHNAKDLAIGVSTEASELLDIFRFKSEKQVEDMFNDAKTLGEISDEIADTLYFILRFSQKYKIDLSSSLKKKMDTNNKKYPIDKFKGSNKKYDEL